MMDSPNQTDHKTCQKSLSSCSKCDHSVKYLMEQEKFLISDCSASFSSSDKYDYSKRMSKNSDLKPLVDQTEKCNFVLCSENEIKGNKSTDYDVVIKQFDDLISELSNSEDSGKKYSNSSNLCDIIEENFMKNNVKNLKEKTVPGSENYSDNSASWKENDSSAQSYKLRYTTSGKKIDPVNSISCMDKDNCNLYCKDLSNKNPNESSFGTKENMSWIDSNLWHFENEKQPYQFQKPISQKVKKNIYPDVSIGSSKGMHLNLTQPTASSFEHRNVLNQSSFYAAQVPKQRDISYLGYKGIMKNDYRFPHSGVYFKDMNVYNHNFQTVKVGGTISVQKSPRTSRSPASKYVLPNNCFVVKLFIETRDLHLGPFPFEIYPKMSLRLLKLKVEQEHSIIASSQRWILGKCFAADNDKALVDYNVMPGSSIILYVDNSQRVSYDASKNEFIGVRNAIQTNNKVINDNISVEGKECSTIPGSLHNELKHMEASVLLRKDSVASPLVHSYSKTDNDYFVKSQNSDNVSIIKEQSCNPVLQGIICDKTKSPKIKKKGLKKNTDLKKKTKIVVAGQSYILTDNYKEKSSLDKHNSNNYNDHEPDIFLEEKRSTAKNCLTNSVQTETSYESKSNHSQVTSVYDVLNTNEMNNSDILVQHHQQTSLEEIASAPFNFLPVDEKISEETVKMASVEDIKLTESSKNFLLRSSEESNLPGPFSTMFSGKDFKIFSGEDEDRNRNINNVDNSLNITEKCDIKDKFLSEEAESLILSNISFIPEKEMIDDLHHKTELGSQVSYEEYRKNEDTNVEDYSVNISGKLDFEGTFPAKEPENLIQSNKSCLRQIEKVENLHKRITSSENNEPKPRRSVTSLIRKLSLTRKEKSFDDSSSLDYNCSNKLHNDEITEENASKHPTLNTNQSLYSDIHIEISPENPDVIASNDKSTGQCGDEHLSVDSAVHNPESVKNFELLLEIENMDLVENSTNFICPVCFDEFESGQGVILHDCLHVFCRDCLASSVSYADGALVKCPYRDDFYSCQSHLQQREIKALVSEGVYEKYLQRSIITAEGSEERSFHCKTLDCPGWCIYDNAINVFHCPVCFRYNCFNCQAIHEGLNCRQYQDKLKLQQKIDQDAQKTLELLNKMIEGGKALRCPKCDLILMKKWGCDWLKCSICQTEICWITKGPRWGPGGQGDTSGGCRCGVNGVKCHPSCTYCH